MNKTNYVGKTREDAVNQATIALQELEKDLYIKEVEVKTGLFNKKVEIEVITKQDVIDFIKEYIKDLIEHMGLTANIEVKKREDSVTFTVYADNNAILIGKNGRTLESLTTIVKQTVHKEIGTYFNMTIDIGEYKVQQQKRLESLAKRVAREVGKTKIALAQPQLRQATVSGNAGSRKGRVRPEPHQRTSDGRVPVRRDPQ